MHKVLSALVACVVLVVPSVARAQSALEPAANVRIGDLLRVTLQEGDRVEGIARAFRPDGISLETADGARILPVGRIATVQRRDSTRNGLLVGAGIGLGVGMVPLLYGNECRYETCAGSQIGLPLAGAVIGGVIGWGIDRAIGRWTTVYDRASGRAHVSFHARQGMMAMRAVFSW